MVYSALRAARIVSRYLFRIIRRHFLLGPPGYHVDKSIPTRHVSAPIRALLTGVQPSKPDSSGAAFD